MGKTKTVIRNRRPAGCLVFCLLLLSASALPAVKDQLKPHDRYALIFGTVYGPDDRPVYGITVKLRRAQDKEKHARWEVYSNHRGEFAQRVPAGKMEYIVWADVKGVKTEDGTKLGPGDPVHVSIEDDERADIGLHLTKR